MPKLKPGEIALRRSEIVEAARRCFIRSGFHQTTTDEICREANITPGGLYHYFSNKDELIKAVIQYAATNALERVREAVETEPDPRSALRRMGAFMIQTLDDPDFEAIARLDLETWSEALRNPALLEQLHEARRTTRDSVAEVIRQGIERGDLNEQIDPAALASLFISINTGLRMGRLLGPNDVDPAMIMETLGGLVRGELIRGQPVTPPASPSPDGASPPASARSG